MMILFIKKWDDGDLMFRLDNVTLKKIKSTQ